MSHNFFYYILFYIVTELCLTSFPAQLDLECLGGMSGIFLRLPTSPGTRSLWNGDSVEASVDGGSPISRGGTLGWGSLQAAWNWGEPGPDRAAQWSTARGEM